MARAPHSMSLSPISSKDPAPRGTITSHRRSSSTASSIGCFVSAHHSDYPNWPEVPSLHHRNGIIEAPIFRPNSAPQPTLPFSASSLTPAELVHHFQYSSYVMEDRLEPTDHRRRSVFLQLLHQTPNLPHHYRCTVPRSDGTPCGKTMNRSDRGVTHIRTHFNHRPFWCKGLCGDEKW
jgi:hypothetical protein